MDLEINRERTNRAGLDQVIWGKGVTVKTEGCSIRAAVNIRVIPITMVLMAVEGT